MNWAQFKDPVSRMPLAGTAVASWSLTQELAGSSPFTVMTIKTFRKNSIQVSHNCIDSVASICICQMNLIGGNKFEKKILQAK